MEKTHWKKLINPDYIGAYALDPGKDMTVTIKVVKREMVVGTDGKKEECTVVYFSDKGVKPLILNNTNAKTITQIYRTPYIEDWAGRAIQLFATPVKAFGETVDALRIRPFVPKQAVSVADTPKCADCGKTIEPFGKRTAQELAEYTYGKYGKNLCADCAKAESDRITIKNPLITDEIKEENTNEGYEDKDPESVRDN